MQGLVDGNPPWQHSTLTELGQGHRANFNLREGEGALDAAKTPYYDLIFETPNFANIEFYLEGADPILNKEFGDIVTDEYHSTLDDWDGFDQNMQLHQYQMVFYGVGPMFWPHPLDWRSEAIKIGKALVPDETKANVDELEALVILHYYRADQLWNFIRHEKNAKMGRWNTELVEKAIVQAAHNDVRQVLGTENLDLIQRSQRCGDYFYAMNRSSRIYVASLFVREFNQKVSHYIITDSPLDEDDVIADDEKEEGYLYKHRDKYESFSEIICPFFFDTGSDGTWHSIKGLGPKIYDFCDISNRMTCQMIDGAVIGSGVTLEAQDANSMSETQVALVGGATVVQPGYKVVQTRIAESLNGALSIKRDLQNTLQSNTGNYRQRVSGEDQEPTLGQAQLNAQQQAMLSKGAVNRYYNSLDRWHRETLRRLLNPQLRGSVPGAEQAEYFRECCAKRGIPEKLLVMDNIRKVKATRSVGYGSPQMRDLATDKLMQMIPLADELGRNNIVRAKAASLPGVGQANVDQFFPSIKKEGFPDDHKALATLENNALRQMGGQVEVTPQQNHLTHFDTHFSDATQHLQDPQGSPVDKLVHMEQAGPHMHKHLDELAGDPTRKKQHKEREQALQQLGKATDKLKQNVDEWLQSQQENAPAPQPDPEQMAALAKVHGQLGLQKQKQDGQFALKAQAQAHKQMLADKKTAADIRLNAMKRMAA